MKLEVGKQYRTRSGAIVSIIHELAGIVPDPFVGIIHGYDDYRSEEVATYGSNGQWDVNSAGEKRLDLIEPVVPEPKCERCGK